MDQITLNDEERKVLLKEAEKELEKEERERLKKEYKNKLKEELRIKSYDRLPIGEISETKKVTINLAKFADKICIDGTEYYHGFTYSIPDRMVSTVLEIMARSWGHEAEISDKTNRRYEFGSVPLIVDNSVPRKTKINGKGEVSYE